MSIENTLAERGNRYGDFTDHADLAQGIQFRMQRFCLKADNADGFIEPWKDRLNNVQRQALTVISDKIARILSGDPNYADNWHDIQGYAKLVEDRLPQPAEAALPADTGCPHCGVGEGALHLTGCELVGMAANASHSAAALRDFIEGPPTTETFAEYEARTRSPAPIDPADVDIFDTDHAADGTLMLDPATWEAGDVLVCVVPGDSVRYGEKYVYTGDNDDTGRDYMVEVQPLDGGRVLAGQRYANRFRFHSRPTK